MKPGKLYLKIFLSFLGVIFITEILILVLFVAVPGRYFRDRMEAYNRAKMVLIQEAVENQFREAPDTPVEENRSLEQFIRSFSNTIYATIWISDSRGRVLLKSAGRDVPDMTKVIERSRVHHVGQMMLYRHHGFDVLSEIPLTFPDGTEGRIHVLMSKPLTEHPERRFMMGLLVIGVVVAILVIPVSRLISKPLNRLRRSALIIAEGDLSHRADIASKDEIGDLCAAFNHMADRVERMVRGGKELTANVSHELRTPLTRIRIAEEMLREKMEKGKTDGLKRHLESIREDIEELDRLIDRILKLSKLDLHEAPLKEQTLLVEDMLNELIDREKAVLDRKKLTLETDFAYNASIVGDREAMVSLFSIVLDNAVKFTAEGGRICVETSATAEVLRVAFSNTFEPMAQERLERIFEPFYRSKDNNVKGTGLGLAIARKIVEKHHGAIMAENTDKGLSIVIRLPITSV